MTRVEQATTKVLALNAVLEEVKRRLAAAEKELHEAEDAEAMALLWSQPDGRE